MTKSKTTPSVACTTIRSYRDLIVWQKAMSLVTVIYELTSEFPDEERYGLSAQMRRSAVTIPSTIAEGRNRATKEEYLLLLKQAHSTGAKLETYLEIIRHLETTKKLDGSEAETLLKQIRKMLNVMTRKPSSQSKA